MPIQTDLNVFPYFDDYREDKDFYKILFRPGVAVQARELNQLQTLFQKQVERFGDNIFKRGTIVNGCNFQFHPTVPYVKLRDLDIDLRIIDVDSFQNYFVKNNSNLVARIIETASGYESTDPDLNTLYLNYLNSGNTGLINTFSAGDTLTVYDSNNSVFSVKINNGSLNFSNNDSVVFLAALEIQNTTGGTTLSTSFQVNEIITQATTGAQANVIAIDTSSNQTAIILKLRPLSNNVANGVNTAAWTFSAGYTITGGTSGASANVAGLIGTGAGATVITDSAGVVTNVNMTATGNGYYIEPYVSIASANNTGNTTAINNLNLTGRNYLNKLTVAPGSFANPVNSAYGFSISEGVIYQKGYFSRVTPQFLIIERYANTPHQKVIGFDTIEEIVNSSSDSTLLDNATGTFNENAPGANRLKLTPVLTVLDKEDAAANDDFFNLVEFSNGKPFKQTAVTEYNKLQDELARRTYDESGNFVLDPFLVNTASAETFADEANNYNVVVDPGLAYINGYKVQTFLNQEITTAKAKITKVIADNSVDVDYGNYIEVNEFGGFFKFNVGALVSLRNTANTYLTAYAGATISSGPGSEIGTARVKSIIYINGEAGSPTAKYRMYLFDVKMASGKNFRDTRAIFYDGDNKGVADLVLVPDGTTNANIAFLYESSKSKLLFPTKAESVKTLITNNTIGVNQGNVVFTYKTTANNLTANTLGNVAITVSSPEYFPYTGTLSDNEKEDIIIVPLANCEYAANIAGTVATTAAQSNVTGVGTSFNTVYAAGDYIKIANSTALEVRRVASITNATHLTVTTAFSNSFATSNSVLFFPKNVGIPFATRSDRSAFVTANTTLTLNLGAAINVATAVSVTYPVRRKVMANNVTKTAKRKVYVKLRANTHTANVVGPWCLGVPDAFRLRNVYVAEDVNVNTNSTRITNEFYVDHNQTEDYYGLAYLFKKPNSGYTITANAVMLAEFDCFTTSAAGMVTLDSYPIDDTVTLSDADLNPTDSTINIVELPEVIGYQDAYYDLRDYIDFRPISANTAAYATTSANANTNPAEPSDAARFNTTTEKYFPMPQSDVYFDVEYYLPRIDRVVVDSNREFKVIQGDAGEYTLPPPATKGAITIDVLKIPAYPSLPNVLSGDQIIYNDRKIANEKYSSLRLNRYTIRSMKLGTTNIQQFEQPRRYTMADIGSLERRIKDLEYYASLSFIEDNVKDQTITSSNDPAINRFKFGFYVDNYTTTNFCEFSSPEYNATIFEEQLAPKKEQLNLPYRFYIEDDETNKLVSGDIMSLPYDEITISEQLNATVPIPVANTGNTDCQLYSSAKELRVRNLITNFYTSSNDALLVAEVTEVKEVANSAHTIELFFDLHTGNDRIEVYQTTGNTGTVVTVGSGKTILVTTSTPIATSEQAVTLSAAERTNLTSNNVFTEGSSNALERKGPWTTANRPDFTHSTRGVNTKYWAKNAGKMSWVHDPTKGSIYKIVVIKGSPIHVYQLKYNSDYILCGNTLPEPPPPAPQLYVGTFIEINPSSVKISSYSSGEYCVPYICERDDEDDREDNNYSSYYTRNRD